MNKTITVERVNASIRSVVEKQENIKDSKAYVTGAKEVIGNYLRENDLTEYSCIYGTAKISDSSRSLVSKEKVETVVSKVNNNEINHIEPSDIYNDIDVHVLSVKGKKVDE